MTGPSAGFDWSTGRARAWADWGGRSNTLTGTHHFRDVHGREPMLGGLDGDSHACEEKESGVKVSASAPKHTTAAEAPPRGSRAVAGRRRPPTSCIATRARCARDGI